MSRAVRLSSTPCSSSGTDGGAISSNSADDCAGRSWPYPQCMRLPSSSCKPGKSISGSREGSDWRDIIRTKGGFGFQAAQRGAAPHRLQPRLERMASRCPVRIRGLAPVWPGGMATIDDGADRWARADISRFEMVSKRRDRTAVVPTSYRSDASIAQLTDNFSLEPVRAASERVSEFRKTCRARPKTENSNEKTMAYSANMFLINRP